MLSDEAVLRTGRDISMQNVIANVRAIKAIEDNFDPYKLY